MIGILVRLRERRLLRCDFELGMRVDFGKGHRRPLGFSSVRRRLDWHDEKKRMRQVQDPNRDGEQPRKLKVLALAHHWAAPREIGGPPRLAELQVRLLGIVDMVIGI